MDIDQQSYQIAKQLLYDAFDNTLKSKYEIIRLMRDINLPKNSDPYKFIGDMRTIIAGIESLEISVNDIVQYFVWSGLNISFQTHLTSITNKCQPSLQEINDNIFEATQRYKKQMEYSLKNDKPQFKNTKLGLG